MDLMRFIDGGARRAAPPPGYTVAQLRAINATRRQWLNALLVDQTRAWLSLGERQPEVLEATATMLTIAAMVHGHGGGSADAPELAVIRGAISAATQCAAAGGTLTAAEAQAFSAAAVRADAIIHRATADAIVRAAHSIRAAVGLAAPERKV